MIGIVGTGGHAKVVVDIFNRRGRGGFVFFDSNPPSIDRSYFHGPVHYDSPENLSSFIHLVEGWHVAIGDPAQRKNKLEQIMGMGAKLLSAIHDGSIIADDAIIGDGTAIMAGAVINPCTNIGRGCIINTAAGVDHDCQISDYVNIGPGCRLAGGVHIGKLTNLGLGSVVIPGIRIGRNCIIGAGAAVIFDIPDNSVAVGVPARIIKTKSNP